MQKKRIMLVEDDPTFGQLVARTLNAAQFVTLLQDSPIGATNAARSFKPHALLVDLELPAFDGAQVIRTLRRAGIAARFFLWSSADPERIKAAADEVRADGWISKSDLGGLVKHLQGVAL